MFVPNAADRFRHVWKTALAVLLSVVVVANTEDVVSSPPSCSLAPELHPPKDYPGPSQLWEKLVSALDYYKVSKRLCEPSAILPHWPPLPSITNYHLSMSDGVKLWTVVIDPSPHVGEKKGAVICRSPYGPATQHVADIFGLLNGAVIVLQDDRGTWRSEGEYDMWRGAAQDGIDTLNWIVSQPWSNGEVSTVGISADGISSATLIMKSPSMVKAQWFAFTTMQGHHFSYPQGAYRQDLIEGYLSSMNILDRFAGKRVTSEVRQHESWSQWWYNLTACRDLASATLPTCHYQQVKWPVVVTASAWDIFMVSEMQVWDGLRMDSDPAVRDLHVLFYGPLGHCIFNAEHMPVAAAGELSGLVQAIEVMNEFMTGRTSGPARSKVKRINIFIIGSYGKKTDSRARRGNYWTSLDEFPDTRQVALFLAGDGKLSEQLQEVESSVQYLYDPMNPTPMIGGANLPGIGEISFCGPADVTERNKRGDVVVFTGERLQQEMAVVGKIFVRLYVSSSAKDTDFFVTVEDVSPTWRPWRRSSHLVRYGVARMRWRNSDEERARDMSPDEVYEVGIDCGFAAYVFGRGHHIRVTVSSAAYPYHSANSNTGGPELTDKVTPVIASNNVHLGGSFASQIILPTVSLADLPRNKHLDRGIPAEVMFTPKDAGSRQKSTAVSDSSIIL
mmetsp:Transcript_54395/g.129630  ORF Transcript_54395/g.129630 Transcript_54395/m.129630 type:complete len:673 (-) Transcript_54395:103-2121(-)